MLNEGNQTHNFISSSGSKTVINYGSGTDFLTSYGSGSVIQEIPIPVPQHWCKDLLPAGKEVNRTAAAPHRDQLPVRRHLKGLTVGGARSSSPTRSFHSAVPAYLEVVTKLYLKKDYHFRELP